MSDVSRNDMSGGSSLPSFPRGALMGAGTLVAFAIAMAIFGRMNGPDLSMKQGTVITQRDIAFEDRADGTIAVLDTNTHALAAVIGVGQDNFVRATMRGLAQQRKREDLGPQVPFRLTRWTDGRLTLTDPDTHREVELEAFGETNEAAFARILMSTEQKLGEQKLGEQKLGGITQ